MRGRRRLPATHNAFRCWLYIIILSSPVFFMMPSLEFPGLSTKSAGFFFSVSGGQPKILPAFNQDEICLKVNTGDWQKYEILSEFSKSYSQPTDILLRVIDAHCHWNTLFCISMWEKINNAPYSNPVPRSCSTELPNTECKV